MLLDEVFETAFAVRKTVWSKRGEKITRKVIDTDSGSSVPTMKRIEVKKDDN